MAQLGKMESEVQQMIQERQQKITEIKDTVELSKKEADRDIADEKQAGDLIKELEQEIEDLTNRSFQVKPLSHTKDHLHFLQAFRSLKNPPPTRDWTTVEVRPQSFVGTLRRSLDQLEETLNMEMEKLRDAELKRVQQYEVDVTLDPDTAQTTLILSEDGKQAFRSLKNPPPTRDWTTVEVRPPSYVGTWRRSLDQLEETLNRAMKKLRDAAELKRVQQYEVDVTLDPDTAHCCLILSEDGKQAHDGGVLKKLPDNPQRFTVYSRVLTRQSFSSGRFYFEVQVKDNPLWRLGVARESINRKFHIKLTSGMGFWVFIHKGGDINDDPDVRLPLRAQLQKVGVVC
ncbi:unnamed protein product [Boreogadus saida]